MKKLAALWVMLALVALTFLQAPTASAATVRSYKNVETGYCLDSNAARAVYTYTCNTGNYQNWSVSVGGSSYATFKNVATGKCLDTNTSRDVYTYTCNGGSFQKWSVYNVNSTTRVFRNKATGYCLDSNRDRYVYTYGCNNANEYQQWRQV